MRRVLRGATATKRHRVPKAAKTFVAFCHDTRQTFLAVALGRPQMCERQPEDAVCLYSIDVNFLQRIPKHELVRHCRFTVARVSGHPKSCDSLQGMDARLCRYQLMLHHRRFSVDACRQLRGGHEGFFCLATAGHYTKKESYCRVLEEWGLTTGPVLDVCRGEAGLEEIPDPYTWKKLLARLP